MILKSKIKFADESVKEAFFKLKEGTAEEKELYSKLSEIFLKIEENVFCGIQIPKKLIPLTYIQKYEIDNCWKINLPRGWRLIYAVQRDEIIVISIILEWFKHKEYENRFNY
jgi:Txe/YoeB family toxin of Txe-Axe toxin-antitoxin module